MMVIEAVQKLMGHIREGEFSSCPFIMPVDNKISVAMFTYYAIDEVPIIVYGYGRFLTWDGNEVIAEERGLFESESELITINDTRTVTVEQHRAMYDAYYRALQELAEHYHSNDRQVFVEAVAEQFKTLISDDALELYRRICPDYLTMLNI